MSDARRIDALVVGGVDFGESDRVVHLMSPEGRLSAFAPAARKSRKRFGGALEPFTTVRLELGRRRRDSDLVALVSAEILRARLALSRDLEHLALASYASELTFRLAPEGIATALVETLEQVLDALLTAPATALIRRGFELQVIRELGYQPQVRACLTCGTPGAFLDLTRGGLFCRNHRGRGREIGPKTLAWLQAATESTEVAPHGPLSTEDAERAARACGPSIDAAVEGWLDRPLGSRRLLDDLGT